MAAEAKIEVTLSNGAKAGQTLKELTKQANTLNKEIKDLKPGTDAFTKKQADLQKINGEITSIKDQIKGTTVASDQLKSSFTEFLPFSGTLQKIGQNIMGVNKGVGGLISQMGLLRSALISTGIGAILVLLGSLIAYLTSTQEGMDKITAVTRPLKAIFDALLGVLQELGGKAFKVLGDAIENPKQALKDLGKIILENVINRFKALALLGPAIKKILSGDFAEGFKDLGNAALQAVTGVEDVIGKVTEGVKVLAKVVDEAWKKGQRLDQLQKSIEKQEVAQVVRLKTLELLLKQQKDIVEDTTKSWDERRAAAENALKTQQAMLNEELSLLDKRIEKMRIEQSLNDTSREQQKELAELEAKKLELQAKTVEQGIEFKKKINELNKAQAQEELAIVQNIENLKLEIQEEGLQKELEKIQLDTERKIEALIGSEEQIAEQRALLLELQEQQQQAIRDKYAEEELAKQKAANDKALEEAKKKSDEQSKVAQEQADFEKSLNEIRQQSAADLYGGLGDLIAGNIKDEKAAKATKKVLGLGEVGFNLIRELSANALTAAANPLNSITFGAAGAAQLTALNIASGIRAGIGIAKILAFRKGGIPDGVLRGPSHEQGGIPLVAEGKEIILTKGVYDNPYLRSIASQINVAGGGRKFATGGPVSPFKDRAPLSYSQAKGGNNEATEAQQRIEKLLMANIEATNSRFDRIKVENVATETEAVNNEIKKIQNAADV